jgi:DNA transformation protein
MAQRSEFLALVTEQLAGLGTITASRMFGGQGLYCDGLFIAIISGEKLYFKVDAQTQPEFEARGLPRLGYRARGETVQLMYYEAPAEVDEAQAMRDWSRLALAAAVRARKPARKN